MLAVTDPATGVRRVRDGVVLSEAADGVALTRWSPMPGVRVDTALDGGAPWHVRVHRVSTDRELVLSETGFALPWEPEGFGTTSARDARARPRPRGRRRGEARRSSTSRTGTVRHVDAEVVALSPNANIMWPHTHRARTRDDGARR